MDKRVKNKMDRALQEKAMKVFAAATNISPVDAIDADAWCHECTRAISQLQLEVIKAVDTVITSNHKI